MVFIAQFLVASCTLASDSWYSSFILSLIKLDFLVLLLVDLFQLYFVRGSLALKVWFRISVFILNLILNCHIIASA